ncbi:5-hydroxytryptamine receptor 3E-like [Brachyistius frenatus]|uniref:5-hydroxytryptamine receptor 3E-like n=1 Tax=Brachyistius frenatus TaxID=100188 RepID=UPI0037E78528
MTMVGILGVIWQNEFVSWDPEECGSYWITLPRKRLWVPDIVINEFMGKNTAPFVPYTYLSYDGTVLDEKPIRVVSSCRLDIFTFPFDIQNCTFSFNSYLYLGTDVNLEITWTGEDMFQISQHTITTMGEWELVGITAQKFERKTYANEDYDEIRFYIALRRRATLYVVNLLVPTCFLITVDLFSFMLPPRSVDRSLFKMTLVLGYTVFLLSMNDLLPITGNTIPLINVFLSLCLALMVASLLESILITNLLCGSAHYSPVPHWLRVLVLHILGPLVRLPHQSEKSSLVSSAVEIEVYSIMEDDSKTPEQTVLLNDDMTLQELRSMGRDLQAIRLQVEQQLSRNQNTEEWIQVGFIIDRLLFILYILFISLSFICIIIMWVNWYQTHFNF